MNARHEIGWRDCVAIGVTASNILQACRPVFVHGCARELIVLGLSVGSWTEMVALASWISSSLSQAGTELWAHLPTLDEAIVGTAEAANRLIDGEICLKAWFERQDDQVQVLIWIMLGCFGLVGIAGIASRTR